MDMVSLQETLREDDTRILTSGRRDQTFSIWIPLTEVPFQPGCEKRNFLVGDSKCRGEAQDVAGGGIGQKEKAIFESLLDQRDRACGVGLSVGQDHFQTEHQTYTSHVPNAG